MYTVDRPKKIFLDSRLSSKINRRVLKKKNALKPFFCLVNQQGLAIRANTKDCIENDGKRNGF